MFLLSGVLHSNAEAMSFEISVKADPHAKNQGQRSNSSKVRAFADGWTERQTNGHYKTYLISHASRSIINFFAIRVLLLTDLLVQCVL